MKFRVEYKRTVRVRQYETLTIGWMEEYDKGDISDHMAFAGVRSIVEYHIERELERLTKKKAGA